MPSIAARLTPGERQQLTFGASTAFERAALAPADGLNPPGATPNDHAAATLRTWTQVFSPGDPAAFERRLGWDGLDVATVRQRLSVPAASLPEPDWIAGLERILWYAPIVADDLERDRLPEANLFDADEPPPFLELLVPALRAAIRELQEVVRLDVTLSRSAAAALERQLLRDLGGLTALAWLEHFRRAQSRGEGGYTAFTRAMLRDGLLGFFLHYPMLARQAASAVTRWVTTTTEILRRLEADRAALARELGDGSSLGRVQSLEPALSDPHAGGRGVVGLEFESGLRVIYKPRHVGLERAFGELTTWAAARGLEPRQPTVRVIERPGYGWMQYVDQEPLSGVDEVEQYYRASGGLLCLMYVLRGKDLHMENIVATREGPVPIDLELMLQPATPAMASYRPNVGHAGGEEQNGEHCLTSSLLTFVEEGSGHVFDMGGLRGTGRGVPSVARRVWRHLGSDAIDYAGEWTFETRVRNQVLLDGQPQRPDDYGEEICRGFEDAYEFLMAHRSEILAPEGPLSRFAGCVSRVLLRSTNQYGLLRYLLVRPQYVKDGARWSAALDALNRPFSRSQERPAVWPVIVAEREALEALDVPHFTVATDETMIRTTGQPVMDGYFAQSGLSLVRDRLGRLSSADLRAQLDHLTCALRESVYTRFQSEPDVDVTRGDELGLEAFLTAHALWIARELFDHAAPRPGRDQSVVERHRLYDGSAGPALLLVALSTVTGDRQWSAAAHESLEPLGEAVDRGDATWAEQPIGGTSGLASIVYALTVAGGLLGDRAPLDRALRVSSELTDARIEADDALDITGGAAGALLACLALHRVTGEPAPLARAVRCGEHLCREVRLLEDGAAWQAVDGRLYTGFSHGAAGIAYALTRLFDATGDERFHVAAAGGYRYVASSFLAGAANWPIVGSATLLGARPSTADDGSASVLDGGTSMMTALCHGAPGITLAIALSKGSITDPRLSDQLERALETTAAATAHRADHLCCGNLGRAEALLTVGRCTERPHALEAAQRLARQVVDRARAQGHFRLTANPFIYRTSNPGFFRGLSGIAYELLRLAAPARLPSIVAFEAPARDTKLSRGEPR